ncbi:YjfI family protein [Photobacterium sp. TY1-4]|uniref:YjfI family protein n=1 Tax=Photobacterium sp. TY1-4 TaxID=2899122 RepID=UPI0021C1C4F6|nr:YjfI family protein [Photobacterium sp. TY1-4]UXI03145.1 YjfI family protein [Photobacterium sp. TY1-4]
MTWQLSELLPVLSGHEGWLVRQHEQAIVIQNEDNIEAYLAVAGEQILVEVLLFPQQQVRDVAALNEHVLRTHKMFPLSTIGINEIDGDSYYVAFGSLSSQSKQESILIEVATLFRNVEAFIDLYQEYLMERAS